MAVTYFITTLIIILTASAEKPLCPKSSSCNCNIMEDVTSFSCLSQDPTHSLQYSVTYNRSSLQVTMECSCEKCEIPYTKRMFDQFNFTSINSLHFMSCPLPQIPFTELIGNYTPTELVVSIFRKVDLLKESLFTNLSHVTTLIIRSGELNTTEENVFSGLPNVEEIDMNMNAIRSLPDGIFNNNPKLRKIVLDGNSLSKFPKIQPTLQDLEIISLNHNRLKQLQDSFSFAPNLKSLSLSHNRLRQLTLNSLNLGKLQELDLSYNDLTELPEEFLHGCGDLTEFRMTFNEKLTQLPEKFFHLSVNLEIINLFKNNLTSIPASLLYNLTQLKSLDLSQNSLTSIPEDLFQTTSKLQFIDLSINKFMSLPGKLLKPLDHLRSIKLYNNRLTGISKEFFSMLPALNEIDLNNNDIDMIDQMAFEGSDNITYIDLSYNNVRLEREVFVLPINIMHLNLSYNNIHFLPPNWKNGEYFLSLNLTHNMIRSVSVEELRFKSNQVVVDLRNNAIETVNMQGINSTSPEQPIIQPIVSSTPKILIEENPIKCDCNLIEFVRYLKHKNLDENAAIFFEATNLKCRQPINSITKGQVLTSVNEDNLYCPVSQGCFNRCQCRKTPISQITEVHCEGKELTELFTQTPSNTSKLFVNNNHLISITSLKYIIWQNLLEAQFSNNDIEFIEESFQLPRRLKLLTLDGNKLKNMPKWLMEAISANKMLTVTLGNNSWYCDCTTVAFNRWLTTTEPGKISDISAVRCGEGKFFKEKIITLSESNLCPHDGSATGSAILVTVLTTLILLVILGIGVFFVYRHRFQVRLWLFRHRLCLWMRTQDDIEAGHPL